MINTSSMTSHDRSYLIILVSGFLGFLIGAICEPTWHQAVESAQVVAGLVQYPPTNPYYMYHIKSWTLLHQIPAIGLRLGFSEYDLSIFISGILGMLSFQALSMGTYALSRRILISLATPFFILITHVTSFGVNYPIILLGTVSTYGVAGLSLIFLAISLISSERYTLGTFLFMICPAVHFAVGLLCWTAMLPISFLYMGRHPDFFRKIRVGLILGIVVLGVSLLGHLIFTYEPMSLDASTAKHYLITFIRYWDSHRAPVQFTNHGVLLNLVVILLNVIWLHFFSRDLALHAAFILQCMIGTAIAGLLFTIITNLPPEWFPVEFLALMPVRILNFNVFGLMSPILGLVARNFSHLLFRIYSLFLLIGIYLVSKYYPAKLFEALILSVLVLILLRTMKGRNSNQFYINLGSLCRAGSYLIFIYFMIRTLLSIPINLVSFKEKLLDESTDPAILKAREGKGILVQASELGMIQFLTRRPILIDTGALDSLPYVIESGPEMNRILNEVYGVDLFTPIYAQGEAEAIVLEKVEKISWQKWDPEQWRDLKRKFQITQIITPLDYNLKLPIVIQSGRYKLYAID